MEEERFSKYHVLPVRNAYENVVEEERDGDGGGGLILPV